MSIKRAFLFFLSLVLSITSYAGANEDYVVREMAKGAAEAYTQEQVEDYISNWVNKYAAENMTNVPEDLGVNLISFINLARSVWP